MSLKSELTEFLDVQFGYNAPLSYAIDFAPLFSEHNDAHWVVEREPSSGKIISTGAYYLRTLTNGVPVALIGAIATDENFRHQGLATKVVNTLMDHAKKDGAHWAFLWTDKPEFFETLGFNPQGLLLVVEAISTNTNNPTFKFEKITSIEWLKWYVATRTHTDFLIFKLSPRELADLSLIESVQYYIGKSTHTTVLFAHSRGLDMQNIIHSWSASTPETLTKAYEDFKNLIDSQTKILLHPNQIEYFTNYNINYFETPMVYVKALEDSAKDIDFSKLNISGLESL